MSSTIEQRLADQARLTPKTAAILAAGRPPLAYKQLHARIRQIVLTLRSIGIGRNDRVAIVLPNGPEMALAFLGVAAGATAAPLNPAYRAVEFEFFLEDLEPKALIAQAGTDSPARAVARARGIPIVDLLPSANSEAGLFTLPGHTQLRLQHAEFAGPGDVALLLHTSGTTSRPKLVPLTHANLLQSTQNIQTTLALSEADRCLNVMPLFHIHGLVGALLASLAAGGSVVCTPGFDCEQFFHWIAEFAPTWYTAVPTIQQAILSSLRARSDRLQNIPLRFIRSSSAALPASVMRELEEAFHVPVIEAYGMTEAAHQICSNRLPPKRRKQGSAGAAAGPDVSIMDEQGNLLPGGAVGEIVTRGSNVMEGYAGNCAGDAGSFTNGWFRTGDQGYLDEDGYLFITGRFKEVINRGGEKISPAEVDQALLEHPAVVQAVAFPLPHPTLGEEIAAAVVPSKQGAPPERELQEFVANRLAQWKVPRRILILDRIPTAATGKVQRNGLAKMFSEELRKEVTAPTSDLERAVASIYAEVLGADTVGRNDNFFDLGGDSLRATQVLSRVRAAFQVNLTIATIFTKAAVSELADEIRRTASKEHEHSAE